MVTAKHVAEYILTLSDPDIGDIISNLKLQKLIYYSQGFHLAIYDKPLFNDPIVAWAHGPVVEDVYHKYKDYGYEAVDRPKNFDGSVFSDEQKNLIKEIYEVYGQFSAWKLRNMTHSESPWGETEQNEEISHEKMKGYFKTLIND